MSNALQCVYECYEPKIDCENQCLCDLNRIELGEKYKERTFICCGTEFTHKKRSAFIHSHINTAKHKKFLDIATQKYKEEYGTFSNSSELSNALLKINRDLKVQLHRKCEELKRKDEELAKKEVILDALREEIADLKSKEKKKSKKFKIIVPENLIDL